MKVGTENKLELWTAILLAAIAAVSVGSWILSSNQPAGKTVEATASHATAVNHPLINPLDPTLRLDLLDSVQNVKYEGKGRNIFKPGAPIDIPAPKTPPIDKIKTPPPNPGPPPPPPINLKFFGMEGRIGQAPRIFLSEGDTVFVAREGDIVNSRYKVLKITAQSVEIEDLLNNHRQNILLSKE